MDVQRTPPLPLETWLRLLDAEYFSGFIPAGGAAVKLLVGGPDELDSAAARLADLAARHGMLSARVDSAATRLHMLQDVFFAVAASLDFPALVQRFLEQTFERNGYPWPRPGTAMSMTELADAFGVAEPILARNRDQWLTPALLQDRNMARDMRSAIYRLCLARLEPAGGDPLWSDTVLQWLRGEKVPAALLRGCEIGGRINRTTARGALTSLCHWVRKAGSAGLLLVLDLRHALRPPNPAMAGLRYTPAALMDAYEVLRELIDDAEHLPGLLTVVLAGPELTGDDPRRSLGQYAALKMRVWPDVRPGDRQNPLAPLVMVSL
jgi:hypothetical protein